MTWWDDFWTWASVNTLGATVVGGLILAALLWALSRVPKLGAPLKRFFAWVWSLRVTTTTRIAAIRTEREEELSEVQSSRYNLSQELRVLQPKLKELEYEKLELTGKLAVAKTFAPPKLKSRVVSDAAQPALPLPPPRWTAQRSGDDDAFILSNAVPRSVAKEVRVEGDEDFQVSDAGHWSDLSGESTGTFHGTTTERGQRYGVTFYLTWYDENNRKQNSNVMVPGWVEPPPREERDVWSYTPGETPF